jgi:multiple sugar transport system ATP-binding protein
MSSIKLEGVEKRYARGSHAVRGVDLEVEDGSFFALVGPSGCGKSTLLSLIAGLEEPTAGRVLFDGADVTALAPAARDVAVVFQSYALYPHKTVYENIAFPLRMAGPRGLRRLFARGAPVDVDARVRDAAARLGIAELLPRLPRELSGGQRQRVALGRALVRRPRAFLLDEPLSNLDAGLRASTRAEIKRLHADLGATFVYVTHDQAEALTLADRVAVLREGRVQQAAPPREVYDRPANEFTARFFGSPPMSIFDARIEEGALATPAGRLALPAGAGPESGAVRAGVRAEDARVERPRHPRAPAGTAEIGLRGRIWVVEPLGAETLVTVELDGGARIVCRAEPAFEGRAGDAAAVAVDPARLHFFDPDTGERLSY